MYNARAMASLSVDVQGRVARMQLRSAGEPLDRPFLEEMLAACEDIAGRAEVSAVMLTGNTATFAAEWSPQLLREAPELPLSVCSALAELPQPVVVALSGEVCGAGLELALACDLRLAAESSRFTIAELACGRLPAAGSIQRLSRLVGRSWAAWLLLTGEAVDAQRALEIGLVNAVHPADRLHAMIEALVERIASRAPLAIRYAKEALRQGLEMPLAQGLQHELNLAGLLQATVDRTEGVAAFLEKRAPDFRGE